MSTTTITTFVIVKSEPVVLASEPLEEKTEKSGTNQFYLLKQIDIHRLIQITLQNIACETTKDYGVSTPPPMPWLSLLRAWAFGDDDDDDDDDGSSLLRSDDSMCCTQW